ncbi:MAG: lycopene cyclase family protein [Mycobacteriaceae bacterium]
MTGPSEMADVAVLGLGPAGRTVAAACAASGLTVTAVDPHPELPWRATYGGWSDEFPAWAPAAATVATPLVWTTHCRHINRAYSVLDTPALQRSLDLSDVNVHVGRASIDGRRLEDGTALRAKVTIDARGAPARGRTQQTAYGVVVSRWRAETVLGGAEALFMDWRTDHGAGTGAPPSFLYAVPLGGDRVLLEETCLARRPGLGLDDLARRLIARLAARGLQIDGHEPVERVRFALDAPLPRREWAGRTPPVVRFGAAAPLVHPASGYSVAAALRLAPQIADIIATGGTAANVQSLIWSRRARGVHALRLRGLRSLLAFAPADVPEFFAAFFALPLKHQQAYLSGRDDLAGTAAAMTVLVPHLSRQLRTQLIRAATIG